MVDFPPPESANALGILAIGGDLSEVRLLRAYRDGIFPWYSAGEPITWWNPDPRFVLFPADLKVSKSMRPYFNKKKYLATVDRAFVEVIRSCQGVVRRGQDGTWISEEMLAAYVRLHQSGYAHSVEVWDEHGQLVGGLYGVALGRVFFGESMFSHRSNASKFGFIWLVQQLETHGFVMIDCQVYTAHLESLGAGEIPRSEFLDILKINRTAASEIGNWGEWLGNSEESY